MQTRGKVDTKSLTKDIQKNKNKNKKCRDGGMVEKASKRNVLISTSKLKVRETIQLSINNNSKTKFRTGQRQPFNISTLCELLLSS